MKFHYKSGTTSIRRYLALPALALVTPLLVVAAVSPQGGEGPAKVVLAELFTGSECPPCAAADLAFDELLEGDISSRLAVLEYHLHVPMPDPMTNPDAEERAEFYGVRGAPTVFIDGRETGSGGGPAEYAPRLFNTYSTGINRGLQQAPAVDIHLDTDRTGDVAHISLNVKPVGDLSRYGNLRLYVVIAEKLLDYTGRNGIEHHKMVVRKMAGGPQGRALDLSGGEFSTEVEVDMGEVEANLLDYLQGFEEEFRGRFGWPGFSAKMHEIDPGNLVVVAFVQADRHNQVLQAQMMELN